MAKEFVMKVNPDSEVADQLHLAVQANDGYCPCRVTKTTENICLCSEFQKQTEPGYCRCGLYYKEEVR